MTVSRRLMMIDDDEIFVLLTKKAIEKTHFFDQILVFDNGLDSLNFIKKNSNQIDLLPEIIFLDLSMPIMDGWQFLAEYKLIAPEINKKMDIYIVSSSISPDDIKMAKNIEAVSDFIVKPISTDKLLEIIRTIKD